MALIPFLNAFFPHSLPHRSSLSELPVPVNQDDAASFTGQALVQQHDIRTEAKQADDTAAELELIEEAVTAQEVKQGICVCRLEGPAHTYNIIC